jgi:hypothetical protein
MHAFMLSMAPPCRHHSRLLAGRVQPHLRLLAATLLPDSIANGQGKMENEENIVGQVRSFILSGPSRPAPEGYIFVKGWTPTH